MSLVYAKWAVMQCSTCMLGRTSSVISFTSSVMADVTNLRDACGRGPQSSRSCQDGPTSRTSRPVCSVLAVLMPGGNACAQFNTHRPVPSVSDGVMLQKRAFTYARRPTTANHPVNGGDVPTGSATLAASGCRWSRFTLLH